jgi:hypothetical protein
MRHIPLKRAPDITGPSQLLSLALHDLELVEQDSRYTVDMGAWHLTSFVGGGCRVCMAGAVLAKSAGMEIGQGIYSVDEIQDNVWARYAKIIDRVRCGLFALAEEEMMAIGWLREETHYKARIPPYKDDPEGFKQGIRNVINYYQVRGL